MSLNLGAVLFKLNGDPKGLIAASGLANKALGSINTAATNLGKQGLGSLNNGFKATAGIMQTSLVAGIGGTIGAIGLAITATNKFNESMANVASLMPGSTARVNELKREVQDLAIKMGKSTADISEGLYQVVSAFGDTADTMSILETNAKAAKAGLATTVDAINLTSAVTKAYGDTSGKAVKKAADLAILTVQLGQTTFPELAASVGRVTPLMNELGGSQEELFAVMATMTGVTGGAAEVSTQLAGALQALMVPSTDTTDLMKKMGFQNGKAMIKTLGLQGSLKAMSDEAKKTGKPLQNFIGSIEGQIVALGLSGSQIDDYKRKLGLLGNATGATDKAFEEQTEGVNKLGFRFKQLVTQATVLAERLGDRLAPKILEIADVISNSLGQINIDALATSIEDIFNILFVGDFSRPIFGLSEDDPIIDTLFNIRAEIVKVNEEFKKAYDFIRSDTVEAQAVLIGLAAVVGTLVVGAFATMAIAVIAATWPFIAIGLVVGGLYYLWNTNFMGMQTILVDFWNLIWPILSGLGDMFMTHVMPALAALGAEMMRFWEIVKPIVIPTLQYFASIIGAFVIGSIIAFMLAITGAAAIMTFFATHVGTAIIRAKEHFDFLLGHARKIKDGVLLAFSVIVNGIVMKFNEAKGQVQGAFMGMFDGIGGAVEKVFNGIVDGIRNVLKTAIGNLNGLINNVPDQVFQAFGKKKSDYFIKGFAKGVRNFEGGPAIVGEQGPELVNLPKGSDVFTNRDSKKMVAENSETDEPQPERNIIINFNDTVFADDKNIRDFARRVKRVFAEEGI